MAKRTSKKQRKEQAAAAVAAALTAPPPDDGRIEWPLTPAEERWGTAVAHRFTSSCGRYSVCRVHSSLGDGGVHFGAERRVDGRWDMVEHAKEGIGYAKRFRTLNAACEAVERFHRERSKRTVLETNREELVRAAEVRWPAPAETVSTRQRNNTHATSPEGEEEMATATKSAKKNAKAKDAPLTVKESDARALLAACGVPNAAECPAKKLTSRLNNIAALAEGQEPTGDALALFRQVSKAIEDGRKVEVVGERPAARNGKAAAGKEGPGVIGSLLEFLKGASKNSPLTKKDLVDKLAKRFPERSPDSMAKTVQAQIPTRLAKEKNVTVHSSDEGGYWVK